MLKPLALIPCGILKLERWTTMANEQDKQRRRRERERVKQESENKRKLISISSSLIKKYITPTLFID